MTVVMKGKAKEMVDIVSRHPNTDDHQKRLRYAEQVSPNKFPSKNLVAGAEACRSEAHA